ncbi:ABC transporter permease [Vulcanisaeta souniana JCM 11219]|uniref:ABC transporter permease n=2 Tax=Vulcanisaeta souniana JCM 11219 TaxID=1293586 RepID=A0ABM8BNP4_9CREN|nr:ABC transporter permease [Vulcanisaeta souniana JCM 11219]
MASTKVESKGARSSSAGFLRKYIGRYEIIMVILNIALFLYFYSVTPRYLSPANTYTLLTYAADLGILTVPQAIIMMLGMIDLSPTGIANLVPLIDWSLWQYFMGAGIPYTPALIVATIIAWLLAAFIGFVNGILITKGNVNFLLATVGMLFLTDGLALIGWGGWPETFPGADKAPYFSGVISGVIPMTFVWTLVIAVLYMILFYRTRFGVYVTATGSNQTWARESGVPADKIIIIAYILTGLAGGILGVIDGSRVREVSATNFTTDLTLESIAAAVIGGTMLTGGKGTLIGSFLGAFVIAQLLDGFTVLGVNAYAYDAIIGAAILILMVFTGKKDDIIRYFRRASSLRMREEETEATEKKGTNEGTLTQDGGSKDVNNDINANKDTDTNNNPRG